MEQLEKYYGKRVMLFIDEYDIPFIESYIGGFYDEVGKNLFLIFHNALKTFDSLQYAMLSGTFMVLKEESSFSGLNNIITFGVNINIYGEYFGFSEEETKEILNYYGLKLDNKIKEMYGGYNINELMIYNSGSLVNYINNKKLIPYWKDPSANKMIRNAIEKNKHDFFQKFEKLINQGYLNTRIKLEMSFTNCLYRRIYGVCLLTPDI